MNWFDFHAQAFFIPLFLWGFFGYITRRYRLALVLLMLAAGTTYSYVVLVVLFSGPTVFELGPLFAAGPILGVGGGLLGGTSPSKKDGAPVSAPVRGPFKDRPRPHPAGAPLPHRFGPMAGGKGPVSVSPGSRPFQVLYITAQSPVGGVGMTRSSIVVWLVFALMALPGLSVTVAAGAEAATPLVLHGPLQTPLAPPGSNLSGAFAFVSNFEDLKMDGWQAIQGSASIVTSPSYNGEPALQSKASGMSAQTDVASQGFVTGDSFLSFQAEMHVGKGTGWIGLGSGSTAVAVIGLHGNQIWAGGNPAAATMIGSVPSPTVQPTGWVYLSANVYAVTSPNGKTTNWYMDVYADRTDQAIATGVSVPGAGTYTDAWISTTSGTVDYTNVVVTTYQIPITIPGYNNMDGYGQGSGLLVKLLPAFTTLSASMTLTSWNIPQTGILSFQINAMNWYGTTRSSCVGFFQLGIDLDPNGNIAPWYVPGVNCFAHYFLNSSNPAVGNGFPSPAGSHLTLSITDNVSAGMIDFLIVDHSVKGADRTWFAAVPYTGTEFYGTYTQMEWQPCCSVYPIQDYYSNTTLDHMAISGGNLTTAMPLGSSYMLPFTLDMPPSWNINYYIDSENGYNQVG